MEDSKFDRCFIAISLTLVWALVCITLGAQFGIYHESALAGVMVTIGLMGLSLAWMGRDSD